MSYLEWNELRHPKDGSRWCPRKQQKKQICELQNLQSSSHLSEDLGDSESTLEMSKTSKLLKLEGKNITKCR